MAGRFVEEAKRLRTVISLYEIYSPDGRTKQVLPTGLYPVLDEAVKELNALENEQVKSILSRCALPEDDGDVVKTLQRILRLLPEVVTIHKEAHGKIYKNPDEDRY